MDNNSQNDAGIFELKNLFRILLKRKWWIIITLIVVLIIGFTISFLRVPQYMIQSSIRVSNTYLYYNDNIYKFFPEEGKDLWIFPTVDAYNYETRALVEIESKIRSDEFSKKLEAYLDNKFLSKILKDIIDTKIHNKERYLEITIVYKDCKNSLIIMDSVIDLLRESKGSELETMRVNLISKNDQKIKDLENEIEEISELDRSENDLLSEKNIDSISSDLVVLKEINDLLQNKELLVNRIEVLSLPGEADIRELTSLKRDIVFSFIAALVIGIVTAFIANFFIDLKRDD